MSLRSQLAALAPPTPKKIRGKASFLFESREAAEIDGETIYGIALNGLHELIKIDDGFTAYEATIFQSSRPKERALQTETENKQTSELITRFLRLLSPHFLLKPAHKVIEFLVRKYRIHEYDVDAIVECILPFHDSPVFARMIQLLVLSSRSRWKGFRKAQESGAPLDRSSLVAIALADRSVLRFFCSMPEQGTPSRILASFFGTIITELLAIAKEVDENILVVLVPAFQHGLRAKHWPAYQAATYMALSQLCRRVVLDSSLTSSFISSLVKNMSFGLFTEGLLALSYIVQSQRSELQKLPSSVYKVLVKGDIINKLASLSARYDVSRLIHLLINRLIGNLEYPILKDALERLPLPSHVVQDVTIQMLTQCEAGHDDMHVLVRNLGILYPSDVDGGVAHMLASGNMEKTVNKIFVGTSHDVLVVDGQSLGTLNSSLRHSNPEVRRVAFAKLAESPHNAGDIVRTGLADEDDNVVATILQSHDLVRQCGDVFDILVDLVLNRRADPIGLAALSAIARVGESDKVMSLFMSLCIPRLGVHGRRLSRRVLSLAADMDGLFGAVNDPVTKVSDDDISSIAVIGMGEVIASNPTKWIPVLRSLPDLNINTRLSNAFQAVQVLAVYNALHRCKSRDVAGELCRMSLALWRRCSAGKGQVSTDHGRLPPMAALFSGKHRNAAIHALCVAALEFSVEFLPVPIDVDVAITSLDGALSGGDELVFSVLVAAMNASVLHKKLVHLVIKLLDPVLLPVLAHIWSSETATPIAALRALSMFLAWLKAVKQKRNYQSFIPQLVVALQHRDKVIRHASLDVFASISTLQSGKKPIGDFLKQIAATKVELEQDPDYLKVVVAKNSAIVPVALAHAAVTSDALQRTSMVWMVDRISDVNAKTAKALITVFDAERDHVTGDEPSDAMNSIVKLLMTVPQYSMDMLQASIGSHVVPEALSVLRQLSSAFLTGVSTEQRLVLLEALLTRAVASGLTQCVREALGTALSHVPLDGSSVVTVLDKNWGNSVVVLILEHINARNVVSDELGTFLFKLLGIMDTQNVYGDESDYIRQLILGALSVVEFEHVEADYAALVVRCARMSENPLTVNHALILISKLAAVVPDAAIGALTKMFELVGDGDEFTRLFSVVKRAIVATVEPALPQLGQDAVRHAFVNALSSISEHWRANLLRVLVDVLGTDSIPPILMEVGPSSSEALLSSLPLMTQLSAAAGVFDLIDASDDNHVIDVLTAVLNKDMVVTGDVAMIEKGVLMAVEKALILVGRLKDDELVAKASKLLENLTMLLSPVSLVDAVAALLSDADHGVVRTALNALSSRFVDIDTVTLDTADRLVAIFPSVTEVVKHDDVHVSQAALYTIDVLTRVIGSTHAVAVVPCLPTVMAAFTSQHEAVRSAALIATGSAATKLGGRMLEHIPRAFPGVVTALIDALGVSDLVVTSSLAALHALMDRLGRYVQPYLSDILSERALLHPLMIGNELAKQLRQLIGETVPARLLVPVVATVFNHKLPSTTIMALLSVVTTMVVNMDRTSVETQGDALFAYMLEVLDYRGKGRGNIDDVESSAITAVESLVVKFTGSSFLRLFVTAIEWATSNFNASRFYTLLNLSVALGHRLKSIFVPYSISLLDFCIQIIKDPSALVDACRPSSHKKRKRDDSFLVSVLGQLVTFFETVFIHDLDGVVGRDRIERIAPAMANLLIPLSSSQEITPIVHCIGQLAVLAGSDVLWKPIHFHVLMQTRHDRADVRINAIKVLREFYSRLGEEFLVMLPESMSYLSELMEDVDGEVEKEVRDLVSEIERLLGEPIVLQ